MDKRDKRIYFVISPHINYYHSFRGDSRGTDGFGLDLQIMQQILDMVEYCEQQGLCHEQVRVAWDYGDLYWTMQLQQKFQPDVLDRVIQRCGAGKDEVLLGSWRNYALPILDTKKYCTIPRDCMALCLELGSNGRFWDFTLIYFFLYGIYG